MLLVCAALAAFAGNSVLCRLALRDGALDAWSFTALRILSGAALLAPVLLRRTPDSGAAWRPAAGLALLTYALAFSFAYQSLPAGTGALILFGAVQTTMLAAGLLRGERLNARKAAGIATALAGVFVLLFPGLTAPDPLGAALMTAAGIAWGAYSLMGRHARRPVEATAKNFALAAACCAPLLFFGNTGRAWSLAGVLFAVASGTLTSACGYVLWYAALPSMKATNAAVVQLAVPVLAACAGALLLGELPDRRLVLAAGLTLGGIAAVITARAPQAPRTGERAA